MKPNAKHDDISLSALARCAREAGVTVPEAALPGLAEYLQLLCRWNKAMNLVAPHLADDGIVVILAREEPPTAGDIDGWELVGSFAYTADNVHRWFWALRRRAEG